MHKIKILNIVGARPNFMKIAPVMKAMAESSRIEPVLLHTGQHYDENMSKLFFEELQIPKPDIYLGVGSGTHARQTAKIMEKFDDICEAEKPDAILVVGDVNSTMACSIVAAKLGIKTAHLEAGLRSRDRTMPEEINRLITDSIADILLTPSKDANENLIAEGIPEEKIFFIGNIMIDTLYQFLPFAEKSNIMSRFGLAKGDFVLVTLHRPSNVDTAESLAKILTTFQKLQEKVKIIFPMHPRTLARVKEFELEPLVSSMKNLFICEPLGYLDFQKLMSCSKFVISDSGGIQEETTVLGIPCLTVRENTERPITIREGTNELVGTDMSLLLDYSTEILAGRWKKGKIPELWDGRTAGRVVEVIEREV